MEKKELKVDKDLFYQKARKKFGNDVTILDIAKQLEEEEKDSSVRVRINRILNGHNLKYYAFLKRLCSLVGIKMDDLITYKNDTD